MALVVDTPVDHAGSGSARRRRERRLRAYLRYARMSVAMALAEVNHHSAPRRPKTARARGWTRPEQIVDVPVPDLLVPRRLPPPQEDPATLVPLLAPQETSIDGKTLHFLIWRTFMDRKALEEQERMEQEVVEWTVPQHFSVATPRAMALDVPVLADDDGFFDVPAPVVEYVSPASLVLPAPGVECVSPASAVISIPAVSEQVIEVPKLALPVRAVQRSALSEPLLVEQLVVEPTVTSFSLLQQRTAEQIIGLPVPGREGGPLGGLQGLSQGQGSTASCGAANVDIPVPHGHGEGARGGLQGLSDGQGSTAVCGAEDVGSSWRRCSWRSSRPLGQGSTWTVPHGRAEEVDIPAHGHGEGARGGLQGLSHGQGSTAVCGAENVDIPVPHGRGGRSRGGLQSLSQGQASTAVCGAEHVDTPVPHGGGRHGLSQGQGSSPFCGADHDDIPVPHSRGEGARGGLQGFSPGHESGQRSVSQSKVALKEWLRRRNKVKAELDALMDLFPRTPPQQRRLEELADEIAAMDASKPGPSSRRRR